MISISNNGACGTGGSAARLAAELNDREIYSRLFQKLYTLAPECAAFEKGGISRIPNGDPLYWDLRSKDQDSSVIFLAQYYKSSSGDLIPVPEFEIAIYLSRQIAEVLSCHEPDGGRQVYGENGASKDIQTKAELNACLDRWLDRLIAQGHLIKAGVGANE